MYPEFSESDSTDQADRFGSTEPEAVGDEEADGPSGVVLTGVVVEPAEPVFSDSSDELVADESVEPVISDSSEELVADEPFEPAASAESHQDHVHEADSSDVQWSEIKAGFVDDPRASVQLAFGLVEQALEDLAESVRQRQDGLASSGSDDSADTERLRRALQGYRGFFDELESMSARLPLGDNGSGAASWSKALIPG
jgi:hypothetical protein